MSNNSNQSGALLFLAIIMGAAVYALMFFGSEMEQTNVSASFGEFSNTKSVNFTSNNKNTDFKVKEIRSDLTGVALPSRKMKSTQGGNYAQSSNPGFPTTGIDQSNALNQNEASAGTRASSNANYARHSSQSFAFGTTDVQNISNFQQTNKSEMSGLLLLDTRSVAVNSVQQGSKRATPALTTKTAAVSTSLASNGAKKVDGDPGDPGASLPIGDGVWVLLTLLGVYAVSRFAFRVPC